MSQLDLNASQVAYLIERGDWTNNSLDRFIEAIKYRRAQIARDTKRQICLGSKVKFYSTKRGQTYQGTVEKIAVKFVTVNCGTIRWRVPANMLEIV